MRRRTPLIFQRKSLLSLANSLYSLSYKHNKHTHPTLFRIKRVKNCMNMKNKMMNTMSVYSFKPIFHKNASKPKIIHINPASFLPLNMNPRLKSKKKKKTDRALNPAESLTPFFIKSNDYKQIQHDIKVKG